MAQAQVVECLASKPKALSSYPRIGKKKKKKLPESLTVICASILVSSERRIQARCENIMRMIVIIRKRVHFQ
jgi:hypothetical protein